MNSLPRLEGYLSSVFEAILKKVLKIILPVLAGWQVIGRGNQKFRTLLETLRRTLCRRRRRGLVMAWLVLFNWLPM